MSYCGEPDAIDYSFTVSLLFHNNIIGNAIQWFNDSNNTPFPLHKVMHRLLYVSELFGNLACYKTIQAKANKQSAEIKLLSFKIFY